ncbi:Methyl-accepting chemotaxis protein [Microcystis aeruginosa NIES-2481]|nr:Methyl-accepting chemotaxis protein [Microcystis aeruginosa NIES-2481]
MKAKCSQAIYCFNFLNMTAQEEVLKFDILIFDNSRNSRITTIPQLLACFESDSSLWNETRPNRDDVTGKIQDSKIEISIRLVEINPEYEREPSRCFSIIAQGIYDNLEPKRILILQLIKERQFNQLYVLKDEVSEKIAVELYPYIYRVENSLRSYITKYLSTQLGSDWWSTTAPDKIKVKANGRSNENNDKKNNPTLESYIDRNLYEIDFNDLGNFIYTYSSGYTNPEDLITKINNLNENLEINQIRDAILKLKKDIKSNHDKFFKESFKDKEFQKQWNNLKDIRNKVAHNKLFKGEELSIGKSLSEELIKIIDAAYIKIDTLPPLSQEEIKRKKEAVDNIEEAINFEKLLEERVRPFKPLLEQQESHKKFMSSLKLSPDFFEEMKKRYENFGKNSGTP